MAIRVKCRHCKTEMGHIPDRTALQHGQVKQLKEEFAEEFITQDEKGSLTITSTCEHCEKTLQNNPNYYEMKNWIQ
ncbi:anti-sigma-F factor Fin [Paenisporosarcina indica]|uniref:anti-sigma-F factor Fin n=1 Tax=Paenisporosarcina indica TaxID=650093 RepID=UPI00095007CC|nr:anti-sigma-F factor Fin [Paenisporosarcina indica]